MCLAVPAQLTTVSPDGMTAAAMIGGIEKDVDVSLIDDPKSGDWVIVHVGFALNRIDEAEAQETLKALAALAAPSAAAASNDPAAPSADSEEINGVKYVDEYRSGETAKGIAARIREEADPKREYRFMEFCGGHTHVLSRWGLGDILPESIRMIHGPGCPVCVMPIGRIDMAMNLALNEHVILCTYADAMRVPASKGRSLFSAGPRRRRAHDLFTDGCGEDCARKS